MNLTGRRISVFIIVNCVTDTNQHIIGTRLQIPGSGYVRIYPEHCVTCVDRMTQDVFDCIITN